MEYIYVTKRKIFSVLKNIDSESINVSEKNVFKKKYYFLSKKNINDITTFYLFSKNPEKFIESEFVKWVDSKSYVYESNPAFHKDQNCKHLHSKFENIYIPSKIREKNLINEIRSWGFENKTLFHLDRSQYIEKCINFFNSKYPDLQLGFSDFKQIDLQNSGIEEFENFTINELKSSIEEILNNAKEYFEDKKKKKVLEHFKNKMFLRDVDEPIKYNPTNLDEKEVKKIMKEIDIKYIKPINEIIIQICIKEYLEKNEFTRTFLEVLNFKNCKSCYSNFNKEEEAIVQFINKNII